MATFDLFDIPQFQNQWRVSMREAQRVTNGQLRIILRDTINNKSLRETSSETGLHQRTIVKAKTSKRYANLCRFVERYLFDFPDSGLESIVKDELLQDGFKK